MAVKVKRSKKKKPTSGGKFWNIGGRRIEKFELQMPQGVTLHSRLHGENSGLGQFEFRMLLFQINEARYAARRKGNSKVPKPLVDEELGEIMAAEFPTGAACHYAVQTARRQYNNGDLTHGAEPKIKSYRYDDDGNRVEVSRGRPSSGNNGAPATKKKTSQKVSAGTKTRKKTKKGARKKRASK